MSDINRDSWNELISALPDAHILQTWEWGEVKSRYGWLPKRNVWREEDGRITAAASILTRSIAIKGVNIPMRIMYVPRGPLMLDWTDPHLRRRVLADLRSLAKQFKAIFVKIEPEVEIGRGELVGETRGDDQVTREIIVDLQEGGWISSQEQIQFRNTMAIDLNPSSDELLARMKQKTRYNIRLASRRGVIVRKGGYDDLDFLYRIYAETSLRDGFAIRQQDYYITVWKTFMDFGLAEPLIAEVEGEPVAGLIIFRFAGRAWYMYGMSRLEHREKMPNYLLQWEAILRAKEAGCMSYDLWGAPDEFVEDDSLWGVYRFKKGLGGEVVRYIGAWDLPINRMLYSLYTQIIPRLLARMRRRGKVQTLGSIQAG
jgi:peptidoglycan pentaglycine glycine transferase (the first glycine)